jgi:predicted phosphohydrolase
MIFQLIIENLIILDRKSIKINDICITGCTLWSKTSLSIPRFIKIYGIDNNIYNNMFNKDIEYIDKMNTMCKKQNLKFIVVTHYCPTFKVISEKKKRNKFISFYATNLDKLLYSYNIHTWICGHTHSNFDININKGPRIVSNQKGKPKDIVTNYSKTFTLTI